MTQPRKIEDRFRRSPEELKTIIADMKGASGAFYANAREIGNHAFIEFAGLMNEYIKICEDAAKNGQDFTMASTHTGNALPMKDYQAAYLAEKLDCIYGPALRQPDVKRAFCWKLWEEDGA